ncbi:Lrp/AsnC family transcriptional regulator [Woodsholea maritima]|uniref:Lrp/AsnC family transcriptional regulator n=1 Tax=Woodsholea maritima TaxID=240237 RepID=UPI000363A5B4|nr:Lrp/AsnC family transcriptional regulator [Woodsholea maritima]
MALDATDRRIIRALQRDGRMTNQALSEAVGLSPSPCLRRVRNLEADGVITGYSAAVDRRAYGLPITAFIRVRLKSHERDLVESFEAGLQKLDEVLEAHLITGSEDYLMQAVVESHEAYEHFMRNKLHRVPGIAGVETSFAYGLVKRTGVLPIVKG